MRLLICVRCGNVISWRSLRAIIGTMPMQHIRRKIEELRRYIAKNEARADLEEVDALLGVALEEVRRKLASEQPQSHKARKAAARDSSSQ